MNEEEFTEYQTTGEYRNDLAAGIDPHITDEELKQAAYDRYNDPDYDDDHPEDWEI